MSESVLSVTYVKDGVHYGPVHLWTGQRSVTHNGPVRVAVCGVPLPTVIGESIDDGLLLYQHTQFPHQLGLGECDKGCWLQ